MIVFISYSHADSAQADLVHAALKEARLDPRIDRVNCGLGMNFVAYINDTLAVANGLVLLHSSASSTSEWVREEWMAALAMRRILVLPFLLDDTPLPPLLASRVFADARITFADALALLVRRLAQQFAPISIAPEHASDARRQRARLVNCTLDQLTAVALACIEDEQTLRRFLESEREFTALQRRLPGTRIENKVVDLLCLLQQGGGVPRFANWLDRAPPPLGRRVHDAKARILAAGTA